MEREKKKPKRKGSQSSKSSNRVGAAGWRPVYQDREDWERKNFVGGNLKFHFKYVKFEIPKECQSGFVMKAVL